MVKQFNTASSGDNSIPDSISQNSSSSNSSFHPVLDAEPVRTGVTQSMMDRTSLQNTSTPLAYVPPQPFSSSVSDHWWGRMSFKTKATALAIALGVLPVMAIGGTSLVVTQS